MLPSVQTCRPCPSKTRYGVPMYASVEVTPCPGPGWVQIPQERLSLAGVKTIEPLAYLFCIGLVYRL